MITQEKIREIIPDAAETFKRIMPPIDAEYPEVVYSLNSGTEDTISEISEMTGCSDYDIDPDNPIQYILGSKKGILLCRPELLLSSISSAVFPTVAEDDQESMQEVEAAFVKHSLWLALGDFYARAADTGDLYRFNVPDLSDAKPADWFGSALSDANYPDYALKQRGYWFWQSFAAQAISNYVEYKEESESPDYDPDSIDWSAELWSTVDGFIRNHLEESIFESYILDYDGDDDNEPDPEDESEIKEIPYVNEIDLGAYFADLFTSKIQVLYRMADQKGLLKLYHHDEPQPPNSVDTTCISDIEQEYQEPLWSLFHIIEKLPGLKYGKNADKRSIIRGGFWYTDEDTLAEIGRILFSLDAIRTQMEDEFDDNDDWEDIAEDDEDSKYKQV